MSHITRPNSFHLTTICQLPRHRVDAVAHASQDRTLVGGSFRQVRFAERGLQHNAFGSQIRLQIGKPVVAILQHHPCCPFQQHGRNFSVRFVGGSQKHARQRIRLTQVSTQTKSIQGLSIHIIFAIPRFASKADAPRSTGKSAYWNWHAVYNGQTGIIADHLIARPTPQPFFDRSQSGSLTNEGRGMQAAGRRKRCV